MMNKTQQVYENGTYYNPAWKHYNHTATVVCDKCRRRPLKVCIGYGDHDLCMICVDEISTRSPSLPSFPTSPSPTPQSPTPQPNPFFPPFPVPQFIDDSELTFMMQDQFDKDNEY